MRFEPLDLDGAFCVVAEPVRDERGGFARLFSAREFAERGLVASFVQHALSFNTRRGTLRGLHYQAAPFAETKLVRCSRGAVFDVIVDLREGSPTYRRWCAVELTEANHRAVYVPAGCAHGFQTMADDSEVHYLITPEYVAEAARGIRWDDPSLAVRWPIASGIVMSERDRGLPSL